MICLIRNLVLSYSVLGLFCTFFIFSNFKIIHPDCNTLYFLYVERFRFSNVIYLRKSKIKWSIFRIIVKYSLAGVIQPKECCPVHDNSDDRNRESLQKIGFINLCQPGDPLGPGAYIQWVCALGSMGM